MNGEKENAVMEATGIGKATLREWIGLAVLALPCAVYAMDLTVLFLAVPKLTADLNPSSAELLWISDIYGFMVAGLLVTMGTLGDRIGRRRLLMIGAVAFGIASLFAAFATSALMLIIARAVLGIAGATLAPSTLALIRNMFHDPGQRTVAIGVWVASFSAGGALGPLAGGLLLEYFWWGSVFLVALPAMLLLLIAAPVLLPESRDPAAGRIDLASVSMSFVAVLGVIYGMKRIAEQGVGGVALFAIAAGLVFAWQFTRRQSQLAHPVIDLALFRRPAFGASLGLNLLVSMLVFGAFLFIAQYLQLVLGLSPLVAGLWTVPSGILFIAGATLAPTLSKRFRREHVMSGCLALAAVAFALLALANGSERSWPLLAGYYLMSLALAPVGTLATDFIVSIAPPERAGVAAAMSETSFEFGGALGIALLGSAMTVLYRAGLHEPAVNIPAELLAAARDTLGGAWMAAGQLPLDAGALLLRSAQLAYASAFASVAALCALLMLLGAIAAFRYLRTAPAGDAA